MQTKNITLVNGGITIVDEQDHEHLSQYEWFRSTGGYAFRQGWDGVQGKGGKHWTVWMHREINQTPHGLFTDHVNGNKLDNRRENLRTCNKSQNSANRQKNRFKDITSKYHGVSFHPSTGLWRARVQWREPDGRMGGKTTYHKTPEQAALDYNRMAKERFGEFTTLAINELPDGIQPTEIRQKTSNFRGVGFHKKSGKWRASIDLGGRTRTIGAYATELEAARAYNAAAFELRGDRAKLNLIPQETHGNGR